MFHHFLIFKNKDEEPKSEDIEMEVEDFINNNRKFFFVFLSFRRCFRIIATKRLASLSLSSGTAGIIVVILLLNAIIAGKPLEPKQILKKNSYNFFLFLRSEVNAQT